MAIKESHSFKLNFGIDGAQNKRLKWTRLSFSYSRCLTRCRVTDLEHFVVIVWVLACDGDADRYRVEQKR